VDTAERTEKQQRVHRLLDEHDLDALVLRRTSNVAWWSGGGRTHIPLTAEAGVAWVVVRRDGDTVVTAVNEAERIRTEELAGVADELVVLEWSSDLASAVPSGERVGVDGALPGRRDVSGAVEATRRALTPAEVERYRANGRDAAEALTDACAALRPDTTEQVAAAEAGYALMQRGLEPVVLLVAGGDRLARHRHPLPTEAAIGRLVMLVACGRRHGLIANLTRFVAFDGGLTPEHREAFDRLLHVDTAYNLATRPGSRVGDVFAAGSSAYAEHGFSAQEWRLHHQGGPTGYEGRDYLATAESDARVEPWQAFAWNPSVPELKSEDTVLAAPDGPEVITVDPRWPVAQVDGLSRPLVSER